ncbi:hypothetical protein MKW92_016162, partial [Papaver armeniacum]
RIEFPPLLNIYNLVRQEEVQQSLANTIPIVESATLVVARHEGDTSSKTNKKRSYYCDYCHKDGHTRDRCYKLNGYPPNYKRRDGKTLATTSAVLQGVLPQQHDASQGIFPPQTAVAPLFPGLSADHLARLAAFAATLPATADEQPKMNFA